MAWSLSRNPLDESNLTSTNIFLLPWGSGRPASTSEFNGAFLVTRQAIQDVYTAISPSGWLSKIFPPTTLETSTGSDQDGELNALTTNSIAIANTIRLGHAFAVINGYQVEVRNTAGSNGTHNNIVLDTAPSSGTRIDLVFLELWLAELGGTSASISNTANKPDSTHVYLYGNTQYAGTNATDDISEIDAEINRRWQLQYRIRVVDGVSLDTYPDGINDNVNVKAWGANPGGTFSGYTGGSVYTFANQASLGDAGLFIAGDGSTTARSVLGTVDGYVYAIPICAVSRRNSGVFNAASNYFGCAVTGQTSGTIASGISGRPDGLFYDQITEDDILSLRHQVLVHAGLEQLPQLQSMGMDNLMRGNLRSLFGVGDGAGAPATARGTRLLYGQEISTVAALDAGFKGFSQYDYQRRIFSDAPVIQQTQFTWEGGAAPDNTKPSVLLPPTQPTASTSTSSGTLASGTYYAVVTYVNSYGETTGSPESAAIVLSATGTITINSPVVSGNASGYNVYMSQTSGTETKQNGTPIVIGTNYSQSVPLTAGAALPSSNTTSSTLVVISDSSGLTNGTAAVTCVDGTTVPGTGSLPGSVNILVYEASGFASVAGTWSNLGTATATFKPNSIWSNNAQTNGVVAVVGLSYPGGNGMTHRPDKIVAQSLIQGGSTFNMAQIGVAGVGAADDAHLNLPVGVAVDSSGNIFVADTANHRVIKYNSSLVKQGQFGSTGVSGSDNTHLNSPSAVIVDSPGNIYISDSINHRIVKLNSSMAYVAQFGVTGVSGSDNSHLNTPEQIALDSGGTNIYIADSLNNRIVRITTALAFAATPVTALTYHPVGMAVDSLGNLYTTQQHSVAIYSGGGSLQQTFGTAAAAGSTNYTCSSPQFIAIPSDGGYLFADSGNHRLVKINANGIYIGQFGVTGKTNTDFGHLNTPSGLTIDSTGLIYIGDTNNERILKIHSEMGCADFPLRQFQVMKSGASTDRLQVWTSYRPYQGTIASQGSTVMSYTLRALTDLKLLVSSCGTGGRNAETEDNLNGFLVRLPMPGLNGLTDVWTFTGADLTLAGGASDSAGIISLPVVSWGGSMSSYGVSPPDGNQAGPLLANSLVKVSQNTAINYPLRGANTLQKFVENIATNGGFDAIGLSGGIINSADHMTIGYFLATASGGADSLPLMNGEIVLIVAAYRVNGTKAALFTQTSTSVAVDIFRLPSRPLVRYA